MGTQPQWKQRRPCLKLTCTRAHRTVRQRRHPHPGHRVRPSPRLLLQPVIGRSSTATCEGRSAITSCPISQAADPALTATARASPSCFYEEKQAQQLPVEHPVIAACYTPLIAAPPHSSREHLATRHLSISSSLAAHSAPVLAAICSVLCPVVHLLTNSGAQGLASLQSQ